MGDRTEPLTFGPSARFLPALAEGDTLKFEFSETGGIVVDTEYGSKFEFTIHVLSSSSELKPGTYVWRTTCKAAEDFLKYFKDLDQSGRKHLLRTTFILIMNEYGYTIQEDFLICINICILASTTKPHLMVYRGGKLDFTKGIN